MDEKNAANSIQKKIAALTIDSRFFKILDSVCLYAYHRGMLPSAEFISARDQFKYWNNHNRQPYVEAYRELAEVIYTAGYNDGVAASQQNSKNSIPTDRADHRD